MGSGQSSLYPSLKYYAKKLLKNTIIWGDRLSNRDIYKDEFGNYHEVKEEIETTLDGLEDDEQDQTEEDDLDNYLDTAEDDKEYDEDEEYVNERKDEYDSEED